MEQLECELTPVWDGYAGADSRGSSFVRAEADSPLEP